MGVESNRIKTVSFKILIEKANVSIVNTIDVKGSNILQSGKKLITIAEITTPIA